jgi:4-amino-4-deoxy-L-arabinose transferase-like glycosyltransferase
MLFVACWAASVFLLFSFTSTKLQTYILPSFIAFAAFVGMFMDRWLSRLSKGESPSKWWTVNSMILAVVGVLVALAALVGCFIVNDISLSLRLCVLIGCGGLAAGWVKQAILLKQAKYSASLAWLLGSMVLACAVLAPTAFEVGYKYKEKDLHLVVGTIKEHGARIAIYKEFKPTLMFYLHAPIDSFFSPGQLVQNVTEQKHAPQYVIVNDRVLPELMAAYGNRLCLVCKSGVWGAYHIVGMSVLKLPTLEETFASNLNLNSGEYSWGTLPFAGGKQITP